MIVVKTMIACRRWIATVHGAVGAALIESCRQQNTKYTCKDLIYLFIKTTTKGSKSLLQAAKT